MDPISVTATRGPVVEAVHRVHAAAVREEELVEAAGDPSLVSFLRSSLKPIQAIPLAEAYDDLSDAELAIASASHRASPAQLEAVRALLARAGATVDDLENGEQECRPDGRLGHNCSGKHAGMLAACRANGWPFAGYRLPEHPLQKRIAARLDGVVATGVDGCGVPTFAMSLQSTAPLLTKVPARIAEAMRARPELVGGDGSPDTELMRALPGWIAKGGAEGLFCAAGPDGLGVALKVEDGAFRAIPPAAHLFFARLGLDLPSFADLPVRNSRDEVVGSLKIAGG
jgi:L-asparaginase II